MKKVVKYLGGIVVLLLIALIVTPIVFKKEIVQLVKDTANEELNAKVDFGDFDLSLITSFPDFKLSVEDISVANIGNFEGDTLFSAKGLSVGLNLMSVIKGVQYKINEISLKQPRIHALVLQDSTANWDITKPGTDTTSTAEEPETESAPFKMTLKKFEILNAYILYDDAIGDVKAEIIDLTHTLTGDFSADNFVLETLTEIASLSVKSGGVAYLNKVKTRVKADLDADMVNAKYTFKENEFSLNALTLGLDGFVTMPTDDIGMDLTFKANETAFKNILSIVPGVYTDEFKNVKTAGSLALNGFAKGTYNDNTMPAFGLNLKVKDAMFHYPSLPKSVTNIQVDLLIDNKTGAPDATVIDLNTFHVELAANPVDAELHVSTPVSDANINASLKAKLDLATVKDVIPMEAGDDLNGLIAADVAMKGRMSAIENEEYEKFDSRGTLRISDMNYTSESLAFPTNIKSMLLTFSPEIVQLNNFDSKIGKSDIHLDGQIENFIQYAIKDETLKGTFNLKSSLLDLNELMAEDSTSVVVQDTVTTDSVEAPMTVVEVPANLDVALNSNIGKLLYDNLTISNVVGNLKIKNSKVSMDELKMDFTDLGGSMVLGGSYNTQNVKKPLVDFNIDITDFDISKTYQTFNSVQKLAPIGKFAKGKFATKMTFKTVLDENMDPNLELLSGGGRLSTNNAVVEGFAPIDKLADALKQPKYKKLEFQDVNASFHFIDGRVVLDKMPVKAGNISAIVNGSTGFDQTIDYTWLLEIPRDEFGSQANAAVGSVLSQLNKKAGSNVSLSDKVKVKAIFGGTVTKPTIKTGLGNMKSEAPVKEQVKEKVREAVKEVIDDAKDKAKEKAQAEADKIMRDAQAQANTVKSQAKTLADKTRKEGYATVDKTVSDASNPIAKKVAKLAAPAAKKKVDEKVNIILDTANKKADAIMENAKIAADKKLQ